MAESKHDFLLLGLYIFTAVVYIVEIAISSLSGQNSDIFESNQRNLSALYELEITPASWTFSIWGFIYAWQAIWLVYAFSLIFRRGPDGFLYVTPKLLTPAFLISFSLSCMCVITWTFVWDRQFIAVAFVFLFLTAATLHATQVFGYYQLNKIEATLVKQGLKTDVWLMRLLVFNGLAFYTTWVSIATCLNMAHTIAYTGLYRLDQKVASSAALALLMVVIFFWFSLKTFIFEKQLRFTLSPFVVLVVGLTGSIYKNWDRTEENSIFTAAILTLVGILLVITVVRVITKQQEENKLQHGDDTKGNEKTDIVIQRDVEDG